MNASRQLEIQGLTDVGCVRAHNEDCFLIQPMNRDPLAINDSSFFQVAEGDVFGAVSDGMGGAAAGEVASQTALSTLARFLDENRAALSQAEPEEVVDLLEAAMHAANKAIIQKANDMSDHRGMGATLTAFYLKDDVLYLFQIGDSRAYVLREGRLKRVTRDQSFVGHLVEMGTITEDQAMKHPQRNVILQAMGTQEDLKVDISYLPLCRDDLVLVCSDGLHGEFTPEQFTERVLDLTDQSITDFSQALLDQAKDAGGKDNITLITLRIGKDLPAREPGEEPRYLAFPKLNKDRPVDKTKSVFP